jgi:DNA-binding NtrC family response regulator
MARVLIIGSLEAELGTAARIAQARGARLGTAEGAAAGLARLRAEGADLVLCDVAHDVAWLVTQLAAERIACPVVACGRTTDADAAVRAIRAGAKDFLPLPPDADLIAAMLQAVAGEPDRPVVQDAAMTAPSRWRARRPRCSSPARAAPARRCWRATSMRRRAARAGPSWR